jgi:hypothetical protein
MNNDDDFLRYLLDDDEDDDDDDIAFFSLIEAYMSSDEGRRSSGKAQCRQHRESYYVRRLEWDAHVAKLAKEGPPAFSRLYRIEPEIFVKIVHNHSSFRRKRRCEGYQSLGKRQRAYNY